MNAPLNPAQLRAAPDAVSLDDKYTQRTGTAFMSGVHALVRLHQFIGLLSNLFLAGKYPVMHVVVKHRH